MKILLASLILALSVNTHGEEAFGRPGSIPNWSSAKKVQVGTSYTWSKNPTSSLVWFTNANGVLTETYFPTIDQAQIKDAQILVTDHKTFMVDELYQTQHEVALPHSALATLVNSDLQSRFKISHTYFTMQDSSTLVDEITIQSNVDGLDYYLLVNSAINNTGMNDTAFTTEDQLVFHEGNISLKVYSTSGMDNLNVGFVGSSDLFQDLATDYNQDYFFSSASNGNVAGSGRLKVPAKRGTYRFYIVYDFEKNKELLSAADFAQGKQSYQDSWEGYLRSLKAPEMKPHLTYLYYRSLYTLKVHEDKINAGALIASLSKPWGETVQEYPGVFVGGYHLVWPRDLYHVSLAMIAAGDYAAPVRALQFLRSVQYTEGTWEFDGRSIPKAGAFPQNVWTNGNAYWGGLQIDQVGYPVHLFYQLYVRLSEADKKELLARYGGMISSALNFIVNYGPWTAQERWEENFGISPSSFSVAASALIIGSKIFNDDHLKDVAMGWLTKPNDNIHTWTFGKNGVYGDGNYYLRVAGCSSHTAQWNPNDGSSCTIANSGEQVQSARILDQGFLKLSLMGLVPASDWRIKTSLEKVNQNIRVQTPRGFGWYRYSYDAYGEEKKGRLWPLLSGEHGRYAIERYRDNDLSWKDASIEIDSILDSYLGFANDGLMIPEQVFEHSGEGTGAATPLAWSHAEFIKLLWGRDLRFNLENLLK